MALVPCQKDRILIVDDEDTVRHVFKQVIASEFPGVMIDVATNGMEALKIFHLEHHAIVLMDLFMPIMNGEQSFHGIERLCAKEGWAMPAVMFCTAHNPSREIRNLAASNPLHGTLQKPVRQEVLTEAIRSRLTPPEDAVPSPDASAVP